MAMASARSPRPVLWFWMQVRARARSRAGTQNHPALRARTNSDCNLRTAHARACTQNGKSGPLKPPYDGQSQPNANCNQVFQGIDIRIERARPAAASFRNFRKYLCV